MEEEKEEQENEKGEEQQEKRESKKGILEVKAVEGRGRGGGGSRVGEQEEEEGQFRGSNDHYFSLYHLRIPFIYVQRYREK